MVRSPQFCCFGYDWELQIYPGGDDGARGDFCSVYLHNDSSTSIEAQYRFIVGNQYGGVLVSKPELENIRTTTFLPRGTKKSSPKSPKSSGWGSSNFAKRSDLLNNLEDGTLTIEVEMRLIKQQITAVVPSNPTLSNLMNELGNENTSDVVFTVAGISSNALDQQNQAKVTGNTFHAHHFVLRLNAPVLAVMCAPGESMVQITNVDPDAFKHMLAYCYGGKISNQDLNSKAKEIIDVADRFGVVNLKLEAEAAYIKNTKLTVENVRMSSFSRTQRNWRY